MLFCVSQDGGCFCCVLFCALVDDELTCGIKIYAHDQM